MVSGDETAVVRIILLISHVANTGLIDGWAETIEVPAVLRIRDFTRVVIPRVIRLPDSDDLRRRRSRCPATRRAYAADATTSLTIISRTCASIPDEPESADRPPQCVVVTTTRSRSGTT